MKIVIATVIVIIMLKSSLLISLVIITADETFRKQVLLIIKLSIRINGHHRANIRGENQ